MKKSLLLVVAFTIFFFLVNAFAEIPERFCKID